MQDYKRIPTSAEVYAVIRARHASEMQVFGTISQPNGHPLGNREDCRMDTEWGFSGGDWPILGVSTTWRADDRENTERTHYWLCIPIKSVESDK